MIFESTVFGEAELMRGVAPSCCGLVPASISLGHGDVRIVEEDGSIRPIVGVEVGGVGLIAAHVMRGVHALVFAKPILAGHLQ
jgi:hypothetical protein